MTLRLTAQNSRAYWRALMANVVALIDDAHVLLNNDSPGRARSLLILAQEELARATVLYDTAVHAWEGNAASVELPPQLDPARPGRTKPHLTVSKNHHEKIAEAEAYGHDLKPFWGDYSDWAEPALGPVSRDPADVDQEKQAGFYVAAAPSTGGRFGSPLDVDGEPVAVELVRVAGVAEMALISDHTRMQALGTAGSADSVQDLHWLVLPYAHPDLWADFAGGAEQGE
ncbi:MAG: AbiV family abortive infection protein [Mycobacterium sp.]